MKGKVLQAPITIMQDKMKSISHIINEEMYMLISQFFGIKSRVSLLSHLFIR